MESGVATIRKLKVLDWNSFQRTDEESPWAAFSDQSVLWFRFPERLKALVDSWPNLAAQKLSQGDVTIKDVAE